MFERGYIYRTEADQRADRPSMFARQESNSGTKMTVTREVLLNTAAAVSRTWRSMRCIWLECWLNTKDGRKVVGFLAPTSYEGWGGRGGRNP
jgi:hypothetical protein